MIDNILLIPELLLILINYSDGKPSDQSDYINLSLYLDLLAEQTGINPLAMSCESVIYPYNGINRLGIEITAPSELITENDEFIITEDGNFIII